MELLQFILLGILLIISTISLISHYDSKNKIQKYQSEILNNLPAERLLTEKEIDLAKKLYKINLDRKTPIYTLTGEVSYISISVNGIEKKEWQIADILVARKSVKLLTKRGVNLKNKVADEYEIGNKVNSLNEKIANGVMTEEEAKKEVEFFLEKYTCNSIDFIIPNPLKKHKPVYILNYKNSYTSTYINLLS